MSDLLDKLRAELAEAERHPEWLAVDGGYIQDDSRGMLLRKLIAVVERCEAITAEQVWGEYDPASVSMCHEILKLIEETT